MAEEISRGMTREELMVKIGYLREENAALKLANEERAKKIADMEAVITKMAMRLFGQ